MNPKKRFLTVVVLMACGLTVVSAAFFAGAAWAADAKLDLAVDNLVKAEALLKAAENPGIDPPFGYHRQRALQYVGLAMKEVEASKTYADALKITLPRR